MSRQQLRQHRLLELEKEQRIEDAEGLFMTEEQRRLLFEPFMSVRFEFHDLDGLRWSQTDPRRSQDHGRPHILAAPAFDHRVVAMPNTHPFMHETEGTIRASAASHRLHYSPSSPSAICRSPVVTRSSGADPYYFTADTFSSPLPSSKFPLHSVHRRPPLPMYAPADALDRGFTSVEVEQHREWGASRSVALVCSPNGNSSDSDHTTIDSASLRCFAPCTDFVRPSEPMPSVARPGINSFPRPWIPFFSR